MTYSRFENLIVIMIVLIQIEPYVTDEVENCSSS